MRSAKLLLAPLICMLLCWTPGFAQNAQSQTGISQEVTIIIQRRQVRFTSHKPIEEMRLQVFNQSGEMVFDSGAATASEIAWPLQGMNGEPLASGLYAYTLSIKEFGADAARVRRGHFIIDRAADRDAGSDRLWVTSQDAGVGTELTVARSENLIVAGTTSPNDRTAERQDGGLNRGDGREVNTEAQNSVEANKSSAVAAGTVGNIAKFTSATELGNSVITELNGNIGINTAAPTTKLTVQTTSGSYGLTHTDGAITVGSYVGGSQSGAVGGWLGTRSNHDLHLFTNNGQPSLTIATDGKVGVGTTLMASSRMTIEGQDAMTIRGFEPFLTLQDSNYLPTLGNSHRIQSAHSDLIFSEEAIVGFSPPRFEFIPRMVIKAGGKTGIGNATPRHQLSLGGGPRWTASSWNGSIELVNGAAIGWQSNTAGNRFGIGHSNGGLFFFRTASDPGATGAAAIYDFSISDTGVTSVRTLQLTGGADFAENFEVNAAPETGKVKTPKIEPGMVVSIDPVNPGKLRLSSRAYDRRVAGVISGAGGVTPGMVMGQEGTLADGKHPVALSGRVYCLVDASRGAIKPGDLLTTSPTPGYAMKVTNPAKAQGAIIGKAMTGLKRGKGLVLALVTLQ